MDMKKIVNILIILVLFFVLLSAGCVSGQSARTDKSPVVQLDNRAYIYLASVDCSTGKYKWIYCSGYIINQDTRDHQVSAFIDINDSTGKKIGSQNIYKTVSANGKTAFNNTFSNIEGNDSVKYSFYIEAVT
jgi:hypothetical protein